VFAEQLSGAVPHGNKLRVWTFKPLPLVFDGALKGAGLPESGPACSTICSSGARDKPVLEQDAIHRNVLVAEQQPELRTVHQPLEKPAYHLVIEEALQADWV